MCGRFVNHASAEELIEHFGLASAPALAPRYNITPQSEIPVIRDGECVLLRWGLLPFWAKHPKASYRMINAKAETIAEKPAFRGAFERRRCLIPANGFYEWRRTRTGKQPYYIHLADGGLFAFAGLWERWVGTGEHQGSVIESCAIITTAPNELCARIHDRMPAILDRAHYRAWLERPRADLLKPFPVHRMEIRAIGTRVNDPRNDGPELLDAAELP
jgi:putative SOS response-associated peptidase YedK